MKLLKRFSTALLIILTATAITSAADLEQIQVNVTAAGGLSRYAAKQRLDEQARKQAVRIYVRRLNSSISENLLKEMADGYAKYVSATIPGNLETEGDGYRMEVTVYIKRELIGSDLKKAGVEGDGGWSRKLVVLESPPSTGKQERLFQKSAAGSRYTMLAQYYTDIQRIIKSVILNKARERGISVEDLTTRDAYRDLVSKDRHLVGVSFDASSFEFRIDHDLIARIKQEMPDTLALEYRIDELYFDEGRMTVSAAISMDIRNLKHDKLESLGAPARDTQPVASLQEEAVLSALQLAVENAISSLMHEQGGKTITDLIMSSNRESENAPVIIEIFGNSPQLLYQIKSNLVKSGVVTATSAELSGNRLKLKISRRDINAADQFIFEYLNPLLTTLKIREPTGKQLDIKGKNASVRLN